MLRSLSLLSLLVAVSLFACAPTDDSHLVSRSSPLTYNVPGDFATIQEAVNAADWYDTVLVAPGDYYENVTMNQGVILQGSGIDQTVVHGQIRFFGSDAAIVTRFKVTSQGASGYSPDVGITANGEDFQIIGNLVEGFGSGIGCDSESNGSIRDNITRQNGFGIELFEMGPILVANNLVLNNAEAGIIVFSSYSPRIQNNTVVGNGFAASYDEGGAGIALGPFSSEVVQNNIVVSNHGGINSLQDANALNHHNLVWGNLDDYVGDAQVGVGDLNLDPKFVDAPGKDYRLMPDSPAVDAGLDLGIAFDHDGNPRLVGAAPDLGAYEAQASTPGGDLVVNEVMANPDDERRGEFVELYNPTGAAIDAAGLVLDDGDSTDVVTAYAGATTLVPAGGFAVVLDADYAGIAEGYDIPPEAVLLSVPGFTLGSGLSTTDPVSISRAGAVVSTYFNPFDPGNGISAERIDPEGADDAGNWIACPCGASPGRENCIVSGGGPIGADTLVITEVMATPTVQASEEFIELYNYGEQAVELAGLLVSDGDSQDTLVAVAGKASSVGPGEYAVIIDPDLILTMEGAPYNLDASVPAVVSVAGAALGNGLTGNDPISLMASDGSTVLSTYSQALAVSAQSVERIDPLEADLPANWVPSPCPAGHSAGRENCAASGGDPADVPTLTINEVMANPVDEDRGEFIELYNHGDQSVDAAGLLFSDGDATDVIGGFAGGPTLIPAGGFGVILDPEYDASYSIPAEAILLVPANTTLGNGLTTDDPLTLYAADGVSVVSSFSYPSNPGNGVSIERLGDAGDIAANWIASTCASGSSPGAANCAGDPGPDPDPVSDGLVVSEVMANPIDEAKGEFVEIVNTGDAAVDLAGFVLSDGDASDTLEGYLGGTTILPAGGIAVVLDRNYVDLAEPYSIPAAAVLLVTDDSTLGSGLSTDDPVSLLAPDGVSVLSTYSTPFNPGNGFSAERIDLSAPDTPDNWVICPCPSGSSPGAVNCADGSPVGQVVDVNTASTGELEQVGGIGPATAAAIVAYRTSNGPYEALSQLTVLDAVTADKIADWMVAEVDEPEYVIGLAGEKPTAVFGRLADLMAAVPDPASPGSWDGQPVRIQRAASVSQSDSTSNQDLVFADWGDETQFEPNGVQLPVFLDQDPIARSYDRAQTDHANAMEDWAKEDGDPYALPKFYRWASPLWSYGAIAYAHVYSLEGMLEVDQGAWRLRIRAKVAAGVDRVVMIERWLPALDWEGLLTVWTYNYKGTVVEALSGYSYSMPYRLAMAHPCRQYWFDQHGEWLSVPRCPSFDACYAMQDEWAMFNQAISAWRQDPGPQGDYCFTYDYTDHCFTAEEEILAVGILNDASYQQLVDHCYSSTLANILVSNRPYASVDEYDATYGVGPRSLWNLLVCYVRSGDWPEASDGTVAQVLQNIPDNEFHIVSVDDAEVSAVNGSVFDICDPGTSDCIPVYSYAALPAGLLVGAQVRVLGQVKYYSGGGFWELTVDGTDTWVQLLSFENPRAPLPGDLIINEFLADPGNELCDANCDGLRSATGDEFVELVNISAAPLILDGVSLSDALSVRHVFPAGTTLEPGQPVVIFGGGPLACANFAGLMVETASSGGLSLNNTGDTILLADDQGTPVSQVVYGNEANNMQSMTLSPDLNDTDPSAAGVGGFVIHMLADQPNDSSRFSPGRRLDGTLFVP